MNSAIVLLHRRARHVFTALMLAGALAACGGNSEEDPDTIYFGPLTHDPVHFTLSGSVRYEDRLQGETPTGYGFTGTTEYNPVRHAVIDVVDAHNQVLQTGSTDAQGHFSITATGAGVLRLRVLARTDAASGIEVEVHNSRRELYAVTRSFVPAAGGLVFDAPIDIAIGSMAGAYNILDVFTAGAEFVHAQDHVYPRRLVAYWQPGSEDGTYFTDDTIHVLGGSSLNAGDTDEYDDDVLLHEYGHFVENLTGNLDSLGGAHTLSDNTQDLRLAWSEGWASFVSGRIKKWLKEHASAGLRDVVSDTTAIDSLYLDTVGTTAAVRWTFDMDYSTVSLANDRANSFASSETAVAKVLWGVTRATDMDATWAAYHAFPQSALRTRPISLETYWDNWLATEPTRALSDAYPQFLERRVNYSADVEAKDTIATSQYLAPGCNLDEHTLYQPGTADVDYFRSALSAGTAYTVETFGLTNGADTAIRLIDEASSEHTPWICGAGASQRCYNDNADGQTYVGDDATLNINNGTTLASRLSFTAPSNGNYYVRVTAAPAPSLAAGRYGTYRIRIRATSATCP